VPQDNDLARPGTTYRVLVSTDLGGDPDDTQSLFRLIHYSDILKIEGLVSVSGPGSAPRAGLIAEWVRRVDVDHLRSRGYADLMPEADVLAGVRQGQTAARPPAAGADTEGSRWIIERALAPDPEGKGRPLWVLAWGSLTDVAQALHDEPSIAGTIRLNYIGSSNTQNDPASRDYVYEFMARERPDLWWIEDGVMPRFSRDTFRGCYQGGEQSGEWGNVEFIARNIRGHGSTHGGEFEELSGDAFPVATWPPGVLKEGDTPTFLYLLSPVVAGVGDVDDPTREGWGGRFMRPEPDHFPNYYTDLDADAETCQATVSTWRLDQLSHWKARWDRYATTPHG
jgi:hypothetical protein